MSEFTIVKADPGYFVVALIAKEFSKKRIEPRNLLDPIVAWKIFHYEYRVEPICLSGNPYLDHVDQDVRNQDYEHPYVFIRHPDGRITNSSTLEVVGDLIMFVKRMASDMAG